MNDSIVLIGPAKSGKTSVGRLLAAKLGLPFRTHDMIRMAREHPAFDAVHADRRSASDGVTAWYRYLLPFAVEALDQALADPTPAVIEVSRWYGDAADAELFGRVRAALSKYTHVVLIKPCHDADRAFHILKERWSVRIDDVDMNLYFLRHPANRDLARHVVYTAGRTPTETRDEILACIDPDDETIVLIGPMRAGKSTQGRLLAEALGRKQIAVDAVRWDYKEISWTPEAQSEVFQAEGLGGMLRYWKPFEIHAVERILADHPGCVIDFGAGHSVYDDPELQERARAALATIANVVLLLSSPDDDVSLNILWDRDSIKSSGMDGNRYLLSSPDVAALATRVVMTEGRTPEETCADVLAAPGLRTQRRSS
jgi:shikimate kinase